MTTSTSDWIDGTSEMASEKVLHAIITIDPDLARRWLGYNVQNRPKKTAKIKQYARDMSAGRWQVNGEAIKFDKDGVLLDGQNRLHAIVMSGVTIQSLVIRGLSTESQISMDGGSNRTAADNFAIDGVRNATTIAAGVRCAIAADVGGFQMVGHMAISAAEIAEFYLKHNEFNEAASIAVSTAKDIDCRPGLVCYAVWVLMQIDAQEAANFFIDAARKVQIQEGDPVLVLSRRFAEARRNREKLSDAIRLSMIFRAWNARREGRSLTILRVNSQKGLIEVPDPR